MTSTPRRLLTVCLLAAALWLLWQGAQFFQRIFPDRSHAMIPALEQLQTFCVGRLLIDLPKGTTVSSASGFGGAADPAGFEAESPVAYRNYEFRMARRWQEIEALKIDDATHSPYVKPSQQTFPLDGAVLFTYGHVMLDGPDVHGREYERLYHDSEAYLWRDDTLYSFRANSSPSAIVETMKALRPRADDAIPTEAGFCGPSSFFPGGGYQPESVHVIFHLPGASGLALTVETSTSSDPDNLPSEPPRPDFTFFKSDDFDGKVHRDAKRTVAGREGVEWGMGTTQRRLKSYETISRLRWFTPGKARSPDFPKITITLSVSYKTGDPPSPWGGFPAKSDSDAIDEETFMTYWDVLLDTLRLRPGAV